MHSKCIHGFLWFQADGRNDGYTDRYDEVNSRFSKFCKRAKNVSCEVRTEVSNTNIQLNLKLQISDSEMITTNF